MPTTNGDEMKSWCRKWIPIILPVIVIFGGIYAKMDNDIDSMGKTQVAIKIKQDTIRKDVDTNIQVIKELVQMVKSNDSVLIRDIDSIEKRQLKIDAKLDHIINALE